MPNAKSVGTQNFRVISNPKSKKTSSCSDGFNGLCFGIYLEMGALDGVRYSNSYFFNRVLSWRGVLIELGPTNYASLERNRKNELATVHAGVCNHTSKLHYVERGAVGGIWEFMAESYKKKYYPKASLAGTKLIDCRPLRDILKQHVGEPFYFDFFTLDVEGAELAVLESLNFSEVGFGIVAVECNVDELKNRAVQTLLAEKGYELTLSAHASCWFANQDFARIYESIPYGKGRESVASFVICIVVAGILTFGGRSWMRQRGPARMLPGRNVGGGG